MAQYSKYKNRKYLKSDADIMRLVDRAYRLDQKLASTRDEFNVVKKLIIEIGKKKAAANGVSLVHLDSLDVRASVSFADTTSYNSDELKQLVSLLGQEQFDELFTTRTEFKPNRSLELFLRQAPNPKIENAQRIIGKAQVIKPKAPVLKFHPLDKND